MSSGFFDSPNHLAPPQTTLSPLEHGGFVLRSPEKLLPYARCVGEWV